MSNDTSADSGIIEPDAMYHLGTAKKILKWGDHATRVARRNGLKVRYIAGRAYLFGADIIEYVRTHGKSSK